MKRRSIKRLLIPDIPITVMLVGFAIGASAMGWWFAFGSIVGIYSALFVGHVIVVIGLLLRPYFGRVVFAVLLGLLMWWPAVLNDHIWGDRF